MGVFYCEKESASDVAEFLIHSSAWFEFTPYPFDVFQFKVKSDAFERLWHMRNLLELKNSPEEFNCFNDDTE